MSEINEFNLISSDGDAFTVSRKACSKSDYINGMIELFDDDDDDDDINFSFPTINSTFMSMIASYLTHHDGNSMNTIEFPLKTSNLGDVVSEWDATFINDVFNNHNMVETRFPIFELLNFSAFLIIDDLKELCSARIAADIKGKTSEEIKQFYAVSSIDMIQPTNMEKNVIKENYDWIDEKFGWDGYDNTFKVGHTKNSFQQDKDEITKKLNDMGMNYSQSETTTTTTTTTPPPAPIEGGTEESKDD
jgi:hypothetical protein